MELEKLNCSLALKHFCEICRTEKTPVFLTPQHRSCCRIRSRIRNKKCCINALIIPLSRLLQHSRENEFRSGYFWLWKELFALKLPAENKDVCCIERWPMLLGCALLNLHFARSTDEHWILIRSSGEKKLGIVPTAKWCVVMRNYQNGGVREARASRKFLIVKKKLSVPILFTHETT